MEAGILIDVSLGDRSLRTRLTGAAISFNPRFKEELTNHLKAAIYQILGRECDDREEIYKLQYLVASLKAEYPELIERLEEKGWPNGG